MVSSVSKVRSSSSGGARRGQAAGSSPGFRERKAVSSRSGGYDGEILLMTGKQKKELLNVRGSGQHVRVPLTFLLLLCVFAGSSSANSSPEFTRKDYGIYCKTCGIIDLVFLQLFPRV